MIGPALPPELSRLQGANGSGNGSGSDSDNGSASSEEDGPVGPAPLSEAGPSTRQDDAAAAFREREERMRRAREVRGGPSKLLLAFH